MTDNEYKILERLNRIRGDQNAVDQVLSTELQIPLSDVKVATKALNNQGYIEDQSNDNQKKEALMSWRITRDGELKYNQEYSNLNNKKNSWNILTHPIWSNVIAGIILAILTWIGSFIYGRINNVNVNNFPWRLIALLVVVFYLICFLVREIRGYIKGNQKRVFKKNQIEESKRQNDGKSLPIIREKSNVFFYQRLCDAFPGERGLVYINSPKEAVKRLELLLKKPLKFNSNEREFRNDPIWWFRGGSSGNISRFEKISKTSCVIGFKELEISKIAVYRDESLTKSFVYLEAKAMSSVVEKISQEKIQAGIINDGYYRQEYAIFNGKPISREEYDDGAAKRNGKIIDTMGAELRIRYLSSYNFIITSAESVYNSHEFDRISGEILNGILKGKNAIDEIITKAKSK